MGMAEDTGVQAMNGQSCSLRPVQFALSLGTFLVIALIACLLLAVIVPDRGLHQPWLQFFPGFSWTAVGIAIALLESFVYGFVSGIVFAPIFNFFGAAGSR
jgi:hypothetical protein